MLPFSKCPVCGGEMIEKKVEKLLKEGVYPAVVKVTADVCWHCGERLYSEETVKEFESMRSKLARQETS